MKAREKLQTNVEPSAKTAGAVHSERMWYENHAAYSSSAAPEKTRFPEKLARANELLKNVTMMDE